MSFRLQQSFKEVDRSAHQESGILDSKLFSEFSLLDDQTEGPIDIEERLNVGTQVGGNISRVRWIGPTETCIPDTLATEYFIVGTYADTKNEVSLWKLSATDPGYESRFKTTRLHKALINSSITGLAVLDSDNFALTTSKGVLTVFKLHHKQTAMDAYEPGGFQLVDTQNLHFFRNKIPAAATDVVSTDPASVVTVGEDGSIYEYSVKQKEVVRSLERVDPLSMSAVTAIGRSEIVTGNGGGQVKVWDLRSASTQPMIVLCPNVLMNNLAGATSLAQYPSQSHVLFVGYQSGCMDLWDIRKGSGSIPAANLVGEGGGAVGEIEFHRINEDHFFSCNQLGTVSHWFPSDEEDIDMASRNMENFADLNIEFLRRGLAFIDIYSSPLAINSLSISPNDRIVCGGDSGVAHVSEISGV